AVVRGSMPRIMRRRFRLFTKRGAFEATARYAGLRRTGLIVLFSTFGRPFDDDSLNCSFTADDQQSALRSKNSHTLWRVPRRSSRRVSDVTMSIWPRLKWGRYCWIWNAYRLKSR